MNRFKKLVLLAVGLSVFQIGFSQEKTTSTKATEVKTAVVDATKLSWRKNKKIAKKAIKKGNYYDAVTHLEAAAAVKPKKKYFPITLGKAETQLRDYQSASNWYKKLVDSDTAKHKKPQYLYDYAMSLKSLGKYEEASTYFKQFVKYSKDNDKTAEQKKLAKRENEGAKKGIYFRDSVQKRDFTARNLGANINNPYSDYGANFRDDNSLYYSSLVSDKLVEVNGVAKLSEYSRIYKATKSGKDWTKGELISDNINIPNKHVGNPAFSEDGNTMYYTECQEDLKGAMKCKIMFSKIANGIWEKGQSVGAAVNDELSNNTQPAIGKNKDGESVLFFSTNRNLERGYEIYSAKINNDGTADKPRSLGSAINTKYDEKSPFYDFSTGTFYYSSNGRINIGGFDVYKTSLDNAGEWTEPENMGLPVNSSVDDLNFSLNKKGTKGLVSSNRPGGFGLKSETCCDDLYLLETTKAFLAAKGNVYEVDGDKKTLVDGVTIVLKDERNGVEVATAESVNGAYVFPLEQNLGYNVSTKKVGFLNTEISFNTDGKEGSDTMTYDLFIKKKNDVNPLIGRVISRVYYDYDKSKLRNDALDSLKKVEDIMNQYQNIIVEVGSHTDGKGTEVYNQKLAERRAEAVANYLIYDRKINVSRIISRSYGMAQPVAPNTTPDGKDNPEGRAQNRRTEFKIIDELKK